MLPLRPRPSYRDILGYVSFRDTRTLPSSIRLILIVYQYHWPEVPAEIVEHLLNDAGAFFGMWPALALACFRRPASVG